MEFINNVNKTLKDDLLVTLRSGSKAATSKTSQIGALIILLINKLQFAIYLNKLFITPWQLLTLNPPFQTLKGLNRNIIVSSIGEVVVAEANLLTEQIKADEERSKILRQIENLERQMRSTSQTRRQREIYTEIKKLKQSIQL